MAQVNLTNHFLIAMPNMVDPYFARTLTFICEHNDQGALGVVVNRPIEMTLGALFERLSLRLTSQILLNEPVYFGGAGGRPTRRLPPPPPRPARHKKPAPL